MFGFSPPHSATNDLQFTTEMTQLLITLYTDVCNRMIVIYYCTHVDSGGIQLVHTGSIEPDHNFSWFEERGKRWPHSPDCSLQSPPPPTPSIRSQAQYLGLKRRGVGKEEPGRQPEHSFPHPTPAAFGTWLDRRRGEKDWRLIPVGFSQLPPGFRVLNRFLGREPFLKFFESHCDALPPAPPNPGSLPAALTAPAETSALASPRSSHTEDFSSCFA